MSITEFLEARIAEDEAEAQPMAALEDDDRGGWAIAYAARVLAECKAKRALIAILTPGQEIWDGTRWAGPLDIMAAVYKDHPNYDPEWAR
jgi:hypothetical protein